MEGTRPQNGQRYPYKIQLRVYKSDKINDCTGYLDINMPLQIPKPLFWHHPIITYSNPMAWMQPVGHNIERKIVDYWSTAELNPVESKVFLIKSFLWNRLWTGLCLEFMDSLLYLQVGIWSIILFQSESLNDIEICNKQQSQAQSDQCKMQMVFRTARWRWEF